MQTSFESLNAFRDALFGVSRPNERELKILFAQILETHFPPADEGGHCQVCGMNLSWQDTCETHCKTCISKQGTPHKTIALGAYEGGLGVLVAAAKYGGWIEPLRMAGALLGTEIKIQEGCSLHKKVIVPMPSPWMRTLYRGIDHAMIIACEVSRVTGWPIHRCLKRNWVTPQVRLSRSGRIRGGKGLEANTAAISRRCIQGKEVILIDDVRTTGTTLDKASRMCREIGAKRVVAGVIAMRSRGDFEPALGAKAI